MAIESSEPTLFELELRVNGVLERHTTEACMNLADFVRETLDLRGTHVGCEHGSCGACTVILDDRAVRSCLVLAVQAHGSRLETVEGLGSVGALSSLQTALREHHGVQCGFCTPGVLMSIVARLREGPILDEASARETLSGNLCRCTGYVGLVDALLAVGATVGVAATP